MEKPTIIKNTKIITKNSQHQGSEASDSQVFPLLNSNVSFSTKDYKAYQKKKKNPQKKKIHRNYS